MNPKLRLQQNEKTTAEKLTARAAITAEIAAATTDDQVREAAVRRSAIDAEIDALQSEAEELRSEIKRDEAMERLAAEIVPGTGARAATLPGSGNVTIGNEQRAYGKHNDPSGRTFMRDVSAQFLYGSRAKDANARLDRHMDEVRVDQAQYLDRAATTTSAFAGLVVPQYLTEMYAPKARAMRPFADACNHHNLPEDGMTLNISTITTGTTAGLQASENAAVSETNIDDTLLTINVQTNAASQSLSRQAVERGTGTEDVTLQDMYRAYATTLDSTLINQATTGLAASATTQTFTTPVTNAAFYGQIIKAQAGVEAIMLDMASGDNFIVMHSRRWYSLQSWLSTSFPLMTQPGIAGNQVGVNYAEKYGRGFRGLLPNGAPVVVDNNIVTNLGAGTNQDEVYVADQEECHLWEDPNAPVFIRAEASQVKNLDIDYVLYGFFAYTFSRYVGQVQKITGAGLVPPAYDGT